MPHPGVFVLACLISGVSTALILASGSSHGEIRSLSGTVEDTRQGPSTYDGCREGSCQVAYLNSVEDFCLWAPSEPAMEHTLVAWCTNGAHGTRLIPDGTITGARLLITPDYIQITGTGQLSKINVPADGVASASGSGHHPHGDVFTSAYGPLQSIRDWTSFVSQDRFCFRACKPSATASGACPQKRDIFGCSENVPGDYDEGVSKDCIGGTTEIPSALRQEVLAALPHDSAYPFSRCMTHDTIGDAQIAHARRAVAPLLITSLSHSNFRPHGQSMPFPSTSIDTATIASPPLQTFTPTSTPSTNFRTPVTSDGPTVNPHSYNGTQTYSRSHRHTHSRMHHHRPSSHHFFSPEASSSTVSSFDNSSSTPLGSPSPAPLTPYFTTTFPTSSSDPSSSTSSVLSTSSPASTLSPVPTPSFPPPYDTSSPPSFSGSASPGPFSSPDPSSPPPSTYDPPTPSFASPSTSSFTSSPSSYAQTADQTSSSPSSAYATLPIPSPSSVTSPSSSYVVTFTTPATSVPSTSSASPYNTVPNSETQIGSQCPLHARAFSAGSVVVPLTPFLPLTLPILMIVLSSSIV